MPQQIGKYAILGQIGAGGMGVVYKGYHPIMKRAVAIKTMTPSLQADPRVTARFYREVQAVAQLSHKNIVSVFDVGNEDNRLYLVMEYLEGEDLRAKIGRREPTSLEGKLHIMAQVCDGLAHAHSKGITHRDIKPSNIFVTTSGEVKILDFGLARQGTSDLTATGEVLGTPAYMSPEMLQQETVDHRADVYSAGIVFHEMFTFRKAFEASQVAALLVKILEHEPEPLDQIDSRIPRELSNIVRHAIAKAPEARYQNMERLCADLAQVQESIAVLKHALCNEAAYFVERLAVLAEEHPGLMTGARTSVAQLRAQLPVRPSARAASSADEAPAPTLPLGYFDLCNLRNRAQREYERFFALSGKGRHAAVAAAAAAPLVEQCEPGETPTRAEPITPESPVFSPAVDFQNRPGAGPEARRLQKERAGSAEMRDRGTSEPLPPGAEVLSRRGSGEKKEGAEERLEFQRERIEAREPIGFRHATEPLPASAGALPASLFGRTTTRSVLRWAALLLLVSAVIGGTSWYVRTLSSSTIERSAQELFNKGDYEQADRVIASWLGKDPQNQAARRLQERTRKGVEQLSTYDSALADNDYAKAEGALLQIQQLNPVDPGLPKYRGRLEEQFGAFGDGFDDLQGWLAPTAWESVSRPNDKNLLVRAGLGLVRGRRFRDFDASFNLTFGQGDTAAWILRAADERNYYLLQLNGPRANPPDSFLCFRVVQGNRVRLFPPVAVGKDLGRKDDQLHIIVRARGTRIQHFIESGLAPEPGDPMELPPVIDAAFAAGAFGFMAEGATGFIVRAVSIEPVRGRQ